MNSTALDLCCGAGGLSLGLMRAGFDAYGIDADEDALATHMRHVGPCERGDLRTWDPPRWVDLVAGGIPCQPFSIAGKGLALEDDRYLLPDFLRIARQAHARAVLIENVRGLVQKPKAFRAVLDLVSAEYLTTWTVLDAADYGVPQHRDRLFIVGFRKPEARARFAWPLATHAPCGDIFGRPPYRTVREALGLGPSTFRAGLKEGAKPESPQGMRLLDVDEPAPTIGGQNNADLLDRPAPCVTATEHKSAMNGTQPMGRRRRASGRLSDALAMLDRSAPTITAGGTEGGGGPEPIPNRATREELHRAIAEAGLADIVCEPRIAPAGHHVLHQMRGAVRLTPEQCALLQGFPAGWTWTGTKSSQHRQIGNAVPPALAEAVARSVFAALYG